MKKALVFILLLALTVLLAGCSLASPGAGTSAGTTSAASQLVTKRFTITGFT